MDSKTTFFILVLDSSKKERNSLLFVSPFEEVDFAILNIFNKNTIRIGFCDACDRIIGLRLKRIGFYWIEYVMGNGDDVETPVKKKK
jgi:hypothetical protein